MKKLINVDKTFDGMRIDRFLRNHFGQIPQSLIEKNLRNGRIKLNKKKIKSSNKIQFNEKGISNKIFKNIDRNDNFYFSHEDVVVNLPDSAVKLASNEMGLQSYVINDLIYGVQFHPEFTKNIIQKYCLRKQMMKFLTLVFLYQIKN